MTMEAVDPEVFSLSDSSTTSDGANAVAARVDPRNDSDEAPQPKRQRKTASPSWVLKHVRDINETHRRCLYCPATFSLTTSTGTIGGHLR